ncbi:MAG: N-6 DNA methylase [Eubacteriales bacterium]
MTQEYNPLYLDAVVSNPPYSQRWDRSIKTRSRYRYGIAPKGKADYAFLLHDLYHLKPDGIMTIVLPHGVLFRGDALGGPDGQGEGEGKIRRNLIENNNIEAIIGLPANIFFGTGIPTIIMVLRQKREESDVLFIDASKGFTKVGKTNKLMASDIKRIVDAVATRPEKIEKFARLVSKEKIRRNGYNLNIPRYIDSSEAPETWDIYATMFGGIPNHEIDFLASYWSAFPRLRESLFGSDETPYSQLAVQNVKKAIEGNNDVQAFVAAHQAAFADFDAYLNGELIEKMMELNVSQTEDSITQNIFGRIAPLPLLDKYQAYQLLDNQWAGIATDLEIVQTEGFAATKQVDPNMVIKRKVTRKKVQSGWVGRVIPFDLVQTTLLREDYDALKAKEARLDEIAADLTEIIDSIDEGDRGEFLNDDNTAFVAKEFAAKLAEIYGDISSPELDGLQGYLELLDSKAGKAEKIHYIHTHPEVNWANVEGNSPYTKGKVSAYVKALRVAYIFPEDSFEAKMVQADKLMTEEKTVKKEVKDMAEALHLKTKETIEGLSDEQVLDLLRLKWIAPLCASLRAMPVAIIAGLEKAVQALADKYAVTYVELDGQIRASETALAGMIDELTGSEFDMKGLSEFQSLLKGE